MQLSAGRTKRLPLREGAGATYADYWIMPSSLPRLFSMSSAMSMSSSVWAAVTLALSLHFFCGTAGGSIGDTNMPSSWQRWVSSRVSSSSPIMIGMTQLWVFSVS